MQSFKYKEKFSGGLFFPAIAFVAIGFICAVFGYGFRLWKFTLLEYPNSVYFSLGAAAAFAGYAVYRYKKYRRSQQNPNPIVIGKDDFSFPHGAHGKTVVRYGDIADSWNNKDADHGRQITIRTSDGRTYEFSEDRFDSASDFERWRAGMMSRTPIIKI